MEIGAISISIFLSIRLLLNLLELNILRLCTTLLSTTLCACVRVTLSTLLRLLSLLCLVDLL
jgi:hypothetical protein